MFGSPALQDFDRLPLQDFLNQILALNQAVGPRPVGSPPPGGTGAFTVWAHHYFNHQTGQYVPVDSVLIHEKNNYGGGPDARVNGFNVGQLDEFQTAKPNATVGGLYQVTVRWQDGTQKVWDYLNNPGGTTVHVYDPFS